MSGTRRREGKTMSQVEIKRVVGLEGFANSGKSNLLRSLVKRLLSAGWKIVSVYDVYGRVLSKSVLNTNKDCIVVLQKGSRIIVVVLMGDYENIVNRVKKIIQTKVKCEVFVLFVAMRYKNPSVGDAYRAEFGSRMVAIFKPPYRKWKDLPCKEDITEFWLKRIEEEGFGRVRV